VSGLLLALVLLVALWALTLGSAAPLDLLLGALAAAALLAVLPGAARGARGPGAGALLRRVAAFPVLVLAILRDVGTGTWDVALRVLGLRPIDRTGIVEIPVGERTELGLAVTALALTLSPGEVLIDVDHDRRVLVVHVMDATDPDGVRAKHARFYERVQRRVVP